MAVSGSRRPTCGRRPTSRSCPSASPRRSRPRDLRPTTSTVGRATSSASRTCIRSWVLASAPRSSTRNRRASARHQLLALGRRRCADDAGEGRPAAVRHPRDVPWMVHLRAERHLPGLVRLLLRLLRHPGHLGRHPGRGLARHRHLLFWPELRRAAPSARRARAPLDHFARPGARGLRGSSLPANRATRWPAPRWSPPERPPHRHQRRRHDSRQCGPKITGGARRPAPAPNAVRRARTHPRRMPAFPAP